MAQKKKFKLKKKYRRRLALLFLIAIIGVITVWRYKVYLYHQTYEYKLLEKGYEEKDIPTILEKIDTIEIDKILEEENKIDYLDEIISQKYYMKKNITEYLTYYEENDKLSFEDLIAVVNVGATKEWYADTQITDTSKGYLILTNKFNLLPKDFNAGEIKNFSSTYAYGTVSAESECYLAFINMANVARKEGITLVLTSGYRTNAKQESLYNSYLQTYGRAYADAYAARPGASEHETGLALDVFSPGSTTDMFHTTKAYEWLSLHAQEYGFILRYPENKEHITGYSPESWHYRYVGIDMAKKIKEEGITYDEYYAFYLANE